MMKKDRIIMVKRILEDKTPNEIIFKISLDF